MQIPLHHGKIWIEGDLLHLQFPPIDDIRLPGRPPLQIASHLVRLPADANGIITAEALLFLRQKMLQAGNEQLLLLFADNGDDVSEILRKYREILP